MQRIALGTAAFVLLAGLTFFYYAAASAHATLVNTSKARGDQSAYLGEARLIYRNWTGANNPPALQPRNRMPLYPALLAALYDPAWTDDEFFIHAKTQSIVLSLALLALIAGIAWRSLPWILALNLSLITAFGSFVFRAGYVQSELLFDTLSFATFVVMWRLMRGPSTGANVAWAAVAGAAAALAHLTKAAMLPIVAVFLAVFAGMELIQRPGRLRETVVWRLTAALVLLVTLLGVLYPYIATSKRVFGQYFYNLNTTTLIWYDNYPEASVALMKYGPEARPGPPELQPGLRRYLREHTTGAIALRVGRGFLDMVTGSYRTFWYLKYVFIYVALAALLAATAWQAFLGMIRRNRSLAAFLILYAAVYLPAIAFYEPISGTGTTRFLMAHITPLLFACSAFFAAEPFRRRSWSVAGVDITVTHVHAGVLVWIALDVVFWVWPRVMTTYGGF